MIMKTGHVLGVLAELTAEHGLESWVSDLYEWVKGILHVQKAQALLVNGTYTNSIASLASRCVISEAQSVASAFFTMLSQMQLFVRTS